MKKWIGGLAALTLVTSSVMLLDADAKSEPKKPKVELGVDRLMDNPDILSGKRVGLITNPTGIDANMTSIVDLFHNADDFELMALYGPEHGVRGDAQAGSTISSYIDEVTGLPVYSLYGATKKPTAEMLKDVDVLVFDIQDVGTRFYTYIYTMAYAMEAAARMTSRSSSSTGRTRKAVFASKVPCSTRPTRASSASIQSHSSTA